MYNDMYNDILLLMEVYFTCIDLNMCHIYYFDVLCVMTFLIKMFIVYIIIECVIPANNFYFH